MHSTRLALLAVLLLFTRQPASVGGKTSEPALHIHRVLAIGTVDQRLMVITGPRKPTSDYPLLFNVSASALDDAKGQLLLQHQWPTTMPSHWTNLSSTQLWQQQQTIRHAWTYYDDTDQFNQLYFVMDYYVTDSARWAVVVGMQSLYVKEYQPQEPDQFKDDAIVSSKDPLTFYVIKNGLKDDLARNVQDRSSGAHLQKATRIAKITMNHGVRMSMLKRSQNYASEPHFLTLCKSSPKASNKSIYLSPAPSCDHPLHWPVSSGYVDDLKFILLSNDTVYSFDRNIFDNSLALQRGEYTAQKYEDFFYSDHTLKPSKGPLPKWALIPIALGGVLLLTGIILLLYYFVDCGPSQPDYNGMINASFKVSHRSTLEGKVAKKNGAKESKKPISNEMATARSNNKKSNKKSKKTKKSTKKSAKKSAKKKGTASDLLPPDLSKKMPSLRTNDVEAPSGEQLESMKASGKSGQSSNNEKVPNLAKGAKAAPPMGGKMGKSTKESGKQPLKQLAPLKASGKSGKAGGPASFKAGLSKKTKGATLKSKDNGGSVNDSMPAGKEEAEDDGSMHRDGSE